MFKSMCVPAIALTTAALVLLVPSLVEAGLSGPEYPAPNGNTFSTDATVFGEDVGRGDGESWTFGNIDMSGLSSMYWGPWNAVSYQAALDGATDEPEETMLFSHMTANQAVFTGFADFQAYLFPSHTLTWFNNLPTRLTITADLSTGVGSPIDPTTVDPSLSIGALFPVTNDFSVNLLLEARFPSDGVRPGAWMPVSDGYNIYDTVINNGVRYNISNGFYSEPVCDLDGDGNCDRFDLRVLYDKIAAGNASNSDIDDWLAEAGAFNGKVYLKGDTDLDGSVLGNDFTTLAANFGNSSTGLPPAYWDNGNFDGDVGGFTILGSDYTQLASNFGHVSVGSVPEPNALGLLVGMFVLSVIRWRR